MKLAVVLPSRGVIFSKTVEELYNELGAINAPFRVFFSHGRPIPDCFNIPTEEALQGDYTHILYVEEDMILTPGIVQKLIDANTYAVACDYPVSGGKGGTVMYDPKGIAFFTGCGLLLVTTELLKRMPKPIWRTDIQWKPIMDNGYVHFTIDVHNKKHYGQQDVAFGLRLYANGLPIQILPDTIGQREMVTEGAKGSNTGFHVVKDRMDIVPRTDLMAVKQRTRFKDIMIGDKIVKVPLDKYKTLKDPVHPNYIHSLNAIFSNHEQLNGWLILKD